VDNRGVTALDCTAAGVAAIRFIVGDDLDGDGFLSLGEELEAREGRCDTGDFDGNGFIDIDELGAWGPRSVAAGFYELFAIEVIDLDGRPLSFSTPAAISGGLATRFSFGGGLEIVPDAENFIPFAGDALQIDDELEIYLPSR
jgi:hypothetical protein